MSCRIENQAAFVLSSFVIFISGLIILSIFRLSWSLLNKRQSLKELLSSGIIKYTPLRGLYSYGVFRNQIEILLSAQTLVGQVLVILVFVLSIGSLIIYFINSSDPVRSCSSYEDKTIPIDLTFNAFFSFYFGLRFLAADDKIKFWLEMNSIVDIFTIPPTFISYYLKSNWLGLRFLRALRLLELPQILQILHAIKTSNSVKFSKLLSIFLSTWFTAAGFIHLVENSGDPWIKGRNAQNISYFDSIYLVIATMSTVGFGDVVAKTSLGRIFIIIFTLASLVLFASYVPEVVDFFAYERKYTNSYEVVKGKKFIVVCGNITIDSVTAFLRNFLRHKSGEINIEIVFLGEVPPPLELETIFKCNLAYTTFILGSALKWEDLRRAAVESAAACLILANPLCSDSHAEDTSNIMRVLSIKNYYPKTRVIIQILHSHNKVFLPKIPSWDWSIGDNIICFAELKLGFIAQGCLVPGLCTFLTSLFVEQHKKVFPRELWQNHFLSGLKNKILTQRLSNDFAGMSFPEVSRLCFMKMHLMLIAIEYKSLHNGGSGGLILNPPSQVRLHKNTVGFFIAESPSEVRRAFFYCSNCHGDVQNPELIEKCGCKTRSQQHPTGTAIMEMKSDKRELSDTGKQDSFSSGHESSLSYSSFAINPVGYMRISEFPAYAGLTLGFDSEVKGRTIAVVLNSALDTRLSTRYTMGFCIIVHKFLKYKLTKNRTFLDDMEQDADQLDSSGMFHWCKTTPLDKVILKRTDKPKHKFQNHIVACVFGDAQSALIGLRNFVMPLRASNYTRKELKDIVFIGSLDYLQREWRFLRNFPRVYIMPGSALYSGDLHAVNIEDCSMCAILAPSRKAVSSQILVDTEAIMATLNIRFLRISPTHYMPSVPGILPDSNEYNGQSKYRRVPILTELKNPSNIRFIEQLGGLEWSLTGLNLHLSTSFSTGAVFSGNFLDSLLATAFYNYRVLELLQMLVTGGTSFQLEQHLDKERVCRTCDSCCMMLSGRTRCKLGLLALNGTILSDIEPRNTFGQLFCASLDVFGILCIGLYRMIDDEERNPEQRRFVITRPANEFKLLPSDLVFCAIPYNTACCRKDDIAASGIRYEIMNVVPLTPEMHQDANSAPTRDPVKQIVSQPQFSLSISEAKTSLSLSISGSSAESEY